MAVLLGSDTPGAAQAETDRPSVLHAGLSSLALSVLGVGLGFVCVPVMLAGLGRRDYGAYTLAFTVAGYGTFLDLGFGWAGMRYAADAHARGDRERLGGIVRALLAYQGLIGVLVATVLIGAAGLLGRWLTTRPGDDVDRLVGVLPIAGIWFALAGVSGILIGILRGIDRHRIAAAAAALSLLLGVGGGALLVAWGHGLRAAALCQAIGALSSGALGAMALRDVLASRGRASRLATLTRQLGSMLSFSLWTFLSRLAQVTMLQADKVVAARLAGIAALPTYSVPFGVAQKLNFLGAAAVTAVVPAAAHGQARADFLASYFRTARVVHLCTAAPAIVLLVWAPMLLQSWVGVELAAAGAGFLQVLTLGYWIMSVASVEAGCLDGWGRPRLNAIASLAGLGAASITFLVVAPLAAGRLWAVAGAVTSWMIATGVVTTMTWLRVSGFSPSRIVRGLLQPIVEMAILGIAIAALTGRWLVPGPWGLLAGVALGGVLLAYGFVRLFPGAERRAVLGRLAGALAA